MANAVTDQNFDQKVTNSKGVALVDYWAPWCGPCQVMGPILEELAEEVKEKATVSKLNVDENPQTAQKFGVMSIPTLAVFKSGKVAKKTVGALSKPELEKMIKPYI